MNCPRCQSPLPEEAVYCPKCGTMSSPTPAPQTMSGHDTIIRPLVRGTTRLEVGAVFANRYEVTGRLGEGGMGIVYSAKDQTSGLELVLKLIHPDLVQGESAVKRLMSEGLTAREIRHPNIVAVYDVSQWQGQPYFTMEYVRGRNLRSWLVENLNKDLEVDLTTAVGLIKAILAGLAEAHRMGIVHRDLKPENILLKGEPGTTGSQIKIVDFGIAKAVGSTRTSKTSFSGGGGAGTPLYMAPEQMTSSDGIKPSADLYSLSVMLYEILMDALPQARFEQVSKYRQDVPAAIDTIIEKGLSVRPRSRYQTAGEYEAALDGALGAKAPVIVPREPVRPPEPAVVPPSPRTRPQPSPETFAAPAPAPAQSSPVGAGPKATPENRVRRWIFTIGALIALMLLASQHSTLPESYLLPLILVAMTAFTWTWFRAGRASSGLNIASETGPRTFWLALLLGVASAAGTSPIVTVAGLLALTRVVPAWQIPGTLAVGLALPLSAAALIGSDFHTLYYGAAIDAATTMAIGGAAALGAWHAAGAVARWPSRRVVLAVGAGLVVSALLAMLPVEWYLQDGRAHLRDDSVVIGVAASFVLGTVSVVGFSVVTPLAILLGPLGSASLLALGAGPILATWVVSAAGIRFLRAQRFAATPAFGLAVGAATGLIVTRLLIYNFGPNPQLIQLGTGILALVGGGVLFRSAMKAAS